MIPPGAGVRERPRRAVGLALLVAAVAAAVVLGVVLGARSVGLETVWRAVTDPTVSDPDALIVRTGRWPRSVLGALVGAALGVAGVLMQALTRNPLGDPGVLGINAGAALAVVLAIQLLGVGALAGQIWCGALGAAVAMLVVGRVAGATVRGGRSSPLRAALVGAAVTATATSLTTAVLLLNTDTFARFRFWQVGALDGRGWDVVAQVAPVLVGGVFAAVVLGRTLDALALGEDVAAGLGVDPGRARIGVVAGIAVLCGTATAAAGPVAFVGLAAPHVAARLAGSDHRWRLAYAAAVGGLLLVVADVLGRMVVRPAEIQVGVVTAVLGAPVFVWFVRHRAGPA